MSDTLADVIARLERLLEREGNGPVIATCPQCGRIAHVTLEKDADGCRATSTTGGRE
jgi:hypothetical protein